jgi:F0F1-type ATP synthase delta subunit
MNEEQKQKRSKLAKTKYQSYKKFFTDPDGEEVLSDLMRAANFNNISIGRDPYETYFNEGRRSIVLDIIQTAKLSPTQINRLTKKIEEEDQYLL